MDPIELIAALASALGVWLMATRRPLAWPVGLFSVLIYGWVFIGARLYSDALLQGAFAALLVYGWVRWLRNLGDDGKVRIAHLAPSRGALHLLVGVIVALALGGFMAHFTQADLPWLDAALAAFSLVAQWWQARRHAAAWWLWIAVDVIYIGVYVHKDLFITAALYAAFLALAANGLVQWRRARSVPA